VSKANFGKLFKAARIRAGFSTRSAFVDALSAIKHVYTDEAIGHWERGRNSPPDYVTLLEILKFLAENKGLSNLEEINQIFHALDWRSLHPEEIEQYFPALPLSVVPAVPNLNLHRRVIGRDTYVKNIADLLRDRVALPIVVISGLGGIGKTAAAHEVVKAVVNDGTFHKVAWVSAKLEAFEGTSIEAILESIDWLTMLISIAQQLGVSLPAQVNQPFVLEKIRAVIHEQPCLIALDNIETFETARTIARECYALLTTPTADSDSKFLITSRKKLSNLEFVVDVPLTGLEFEDSRQLLLEEAKRRHATMILNADPALLKEVHEVMGGMPLALILIVSQALFNIAIDRELERLRGAINEQQLYQFIYMELWRNLKPTAQKLLVGAAKFPVPAQSAHVIAASRIPASDFDNSVMELSESCLLDVTGLESSIQRYGMHSMTRWFVLGPLADLWRGRKGNNDLTQQ
jgi:transcriptional regulator with XRE-family HTH domain